MGRIAFAKCGTTSRLPTRGRRYPEDQKLRLRHSAGWVVFQAVAAGQAGHQRGGQQRAVLHRVDPPVGEAALVTQPDHVELDVLRGISTEMKCTESARRQIVVQVRLAAVKACAINCHRTSGPDSCGDDAPRRRRHRAESVAESPAVPRNRTAPNARGASRWWSFFPDPMHVNQISRAYCARRSACRR